MGEKKKTKSKIATLSHVDIFSGLPNGDLAALSAKMKKRSFDAGETVFRENESGQELFVLTSGLVAITIRSQDAEEIELSRVGPGGFFGEMSIIERAPRSATCTALEASDCYTLRAEDFESLLIEQPSAAVGIFQRMLGIATGRLMKTGSFLSQMVQWGDTARKRAITDSASGLFNRRYLEDSFDSILARIKRENSELSFAMFDLDRFGSLNATYGAEFCDQVIVRVADRIRGIFSEDDILIRYGGDELCFIISKGAIEAKQLCDETCDAIRSLVFPEHADLRVTCSIGIASFPSAPDTQRLKEQADKALYHAKENGRDRVIAWEDVEAAASKRDIPTIAQKNRIIGNIIKTFEERDSFLILGHKDPDEDCVSSMVAFALLVSKFNKKAAIALGTSVQSNYSYLVNICRYNSIELFQGTELSGYSAVVSVDTPKPEMLDRSDLYEAIRKDSSIVKIELDHHLEADSRYFGDPDYRLVFEASSTCEIIGLLAIKLEHKKDLIARYQIEDLFSRNLVLAILSGIVGDSHMGRYLKSRKERWFYNRFSTLFERMLVQKTRSGSGNFSNKEQVFDALIALSNDEESCFRFIAKDTVTIGKVSYSVLDAESSRLLFETYGNDIAVSVSKAVVDYLAENGGSLGLVGYYDSPDASPYIQFRMRRSQSFNSLDLREALERLHISNGGGHPGAVGFRIEKNAVEDIKLKVTEIAHALNDMIE